MPRLMCDSLQLFSMLILLIADSSENTFLNRNNSSNIMIYGSPVYTEDQHKTIACHIAYVDTLGRTIAAENRVASSTMWGTGRPSKYTMSTYFRSLKRVQACPINTRKLRGAFLTRWDASQDATIFSNSLRFELSIAYLRAIWSRLNSLSADVCRNCLCILLSRAELKKIASKELDLRIEMTFALDQWDFASILRHN